MKKNRYEQREIKVDTYESYKFYIWVPKQQLFEINFIKSFQQVNFLCVFNVVGRCFRFFWSREISDCNRLIIFILQTPYFNY